MEDVVYRGGLLRFRIPDGWVRDEPADGGGTYYPDNEEGTPAFRVSVISMSAPPKAAPLHVPGDVLRSARNAGREIEHIPGGYALVRYTKSAEEDGTELLMYYWEVAQLLEPRKARLAVFSLTTETARANDRATRDLESSSITKFGG